jgi:predicted transcriptional regulator
MMSDETIKLDAVELATELTIAWLSNPNTRTSADDVPAFLSQMHSSVQSLIGGANEANAPAPDTEQYTPAVSARKSVANPDFIISMIDGKPYKTLRRHLGKHGMTPEEYRERYNLKADYPMVAATYSEARRAMAHRIGLGSGRGGDGTASKASAKSKKPKVETAE